MCVVCVFAECLYRVPNQAQEQSSRWERAAGRSENRERVGEWEKGKERKTNECTAEAGSPSFSGTIEHSDMRLKDRVCMNVGGFLAPDRQRTH